LAPANRERMPRLLVVRLELMEWTVHPDVYYAGQDD